MFVLYSKICNPVAMYGLVYGVCLLCAYTNSVLLALLTCFA